MAPVGRRRRPLPTCRRCVVLRSGFGCGVPTLGVAGSTILAYFSTAAAAPPPSSSPPPPPSLSSARMLSLPLSPPLSLSRSLLSSSSPGHKDAMDSGDDAKPAARLTRLPPLATLEMCEKNVRGARFAVPPLRGEGWPGSRSSATLKNTACPGSQLKCRTPFSLPLLTLFRCRSSNSTPAVKPSLPTGRPSHRMTPSLLSGVVTACPIVGRMRRYAMFDAPVVRR